MELDEHVGSGRWRDVTPRPSQDGSNAPGEDIIEEKPLNMPINVGLVESSGASPRPAELPITLTKDIECNKKNGNDGIEAPHPAGDSPREHGRRSSLDPKLSINTKRMQEGLREERLRDLRASSSTAPLGSSITLPTESALPRSPISPRTRDRGFSLRRSLLARSINQQTGASDSVIELRPARPSPSRSATTVANVTDGANKNSASDITVSPAIEQIPGADEAFKSPRKTYQISSLPHYESWVASKTTRSGLLVRLRTLKEGLRRKILRIRDIPPSKDGRHIEIGQMGGKPPKDDRTGYDFIGNSILSTRYSLYNFLPRQLWAQFSKLANFYFLCVSILQMIPGLSTTGTYTTVVPLLFFVTISVAKEGYDDLRRYRLDKAENNRLASVFCAQKSSSRDFQDPSNLNSITDRPNWWKKTKWHEIHVGDIVKLGRDDAVPADLVVLQAFGTEDMAYVETMALDGETNLKNKHAPQLLAKRCRSIVDFAMCKVHLVVEDPNPNLYSFEGKVSLGEEVSPVTNSEVIYRGSIIRNTSEVIGVVIYSGEECKIRMNATKNPRIKAPALQAVVNKVVIILVIFVIALAIFNTVAYQVWQEAVEESSWYLADADVAFFPILVSFIILFNTMIPLSLYVSLEIVKLFQMLLMNDIDMYDETSNTPMEARTSTINEELGQVNYIFSDKTGTLTNNTMRFRNMSIAGTAWLHCPDQEDHIVSTVARTLPVRHNHNKGKKAVWRKASTATPSERSVDISNTPSTTDVDISRSDSSASRPMPTTTQSILNTTELIRYIQCRPHTLFARKVRSFLLAISLCHTCLPEKKENGEILYQAASPDEQALVRAAQELGYIMVDRHNDIVTIKTCSSDENGESSSQNYQILHVLEFSSNRKRMSVIVRMPDHRICVFCKGADSVLIHLLKKSGLAIAKAVKVEQRANERQSLEAQEAVRRQSEAMSRKDSMTRRSVSIHRPSLSGITRPSMSNKRLQPIRDEIDGWLRDHEKDRKVSKSDNENDFYSPRPSAHHGARQRPTSFEGRLSCQADDKDELVEEALVVDDAAVFERCFQHINDFATEGLRTLLYGSRYIEEDEYKDWEKMYIDASTSLENRQEMIEKVGAIAERDLELLGATAIEDKLQDGVPEAIDKLRRAKIKLWMLTGDKRETAINVGHSCRLIKDYSTVTVLDEELGDVGQRIAATTLEMSNDTVAHSVVVVDGHTLSQITASEPLRKLFLSLAVLVDTVVCCRASPAQKASLVSSIRHKVKNAITLAIGDGANDISMIQEAHVGIGITGKEGLQAARTSDYSIAQFRFLTKLLLVHGRWNYIRTCKYTLGTFWKEMLFYLTQALYQRYAGYTGTSLYESWSLSMFNTLFTSLPVIFTGIFEQDLSASTLLAVPELYHSLGHCNGGFDIKRYLIWVAMAASQAVFVFFMMLGLYGQTTFTTDNGLYAMGDLTFTACIIIIATKMQFWEIQNKTFTCALSIFISIGGWFLWNIILSSTYSNNVVYNVKDGFLDRFGRNPLWWLTLILIVTACWSLEIGVKTLKRTWMPSDADVFRELEKDPFIRRRFEEAAVVGSSMTTRPIGEDEQESHTMNLHPIRTAEENKEREDEVQEILDRRRHSRGTSGASHEIEVESPTDLRRRQHSESEAKSPNEHHRVSFALVDRRHEWENGGADEEEDTNGKGKVRRRSTDVQDMLKRGFGSVRKGLDIV